MDFKIVPPAAATVGRPILRQQLGALRAKVTDALLAAGFAFDPTDPACTKLRNENHYTIPPDALAKSDQNLIYFREIFGCMSNQMATIDTLADRKQRAVDGMSRAVDQLCVDLKAYAGAHGGRFILFGSAASGHFRHDSDVDLIVDFPIDEESSAWRFAEDACWKRKLTPDVRPLRFCEDKFIKHVMETAKAIV